MFRLNSRFNLLSTALCVALSFAGCSEKGLAPEVKFEGGADRLPPFEQAATAITRGDLDFIKTCVEGDPFYVEAYDELGRTLLHYAASSNQSSIVEYLLENGAYPLATDEEGLTPFDAGQQNDASSELLDKLREAGLAEAQLQPQ